MKNILLLVHDDEGQEARLQAALDLTRAVDGHLACLDIAAIPAIVGDPYMADASAILLQDERAREDDHSANIEARLRHEDVSWDLCAATGDFAPAVEEASDLADVIVVNCALPNSARRDLRELAAELIMRSGKPILAVPEECRSLKVTGKAVVAWNGSAASTAALQAAIPLLQRAECVILIEIEDGHAEISARDAAAYLSRHDIHPLIRFERPRGRSVADILLAEVRERRSDYLVMGGYGRSRLAEALFGGTTRALLKESPVPLFLAHG